MRHHLSFTAEASRNRLEGFSDVITKSSGSSGTKNRLGTSAVAVEEFIAIPDNDDSAATAESLNISKFSKKLFHPSGRLALVGEWRDVNIARARLGSVSGFAIGTIELKQNWLQRELENFDQGAPSASINSPGSYFLILSTPEGLVVRGALSGLRVAHYIQVGKSTLVSSHAHHLASVLRRPVNIDRLGHKLIDPVIPPFLTTKTMWQDVMSVPPGHELFVSNISGLCSTRQYWQAPEPDVAHQNGAEILRAALKEAACIRSAGSAAVVCDLSGGLDSTSLFHLLADDRTDLAAFTSGSPRTYESEFRWAAIGAGARNISTKLTFPPDNLPLPFDSMTEHVPPSDGPHIGLVTQERTLRIAEFVSEAGFDTHVMGHGADELFASSPSFIGDMLRPGDFKKAFKRIHQYSALRRVPLGKILREYARPWDYTKVLSKQVANLNVDGFKFNEQLSLPAWVPDAAQQRIVRELEATHVVSHPFSARRHQFETLQRIWIVTENMRNDIAIMAQFGIRCELPYLDDKIINSVLSVQPFESNDPTAYKPLLRDAVTGVIPDEVRNRTTKTEGTSEIWDGMRKNHNLVKSFSSDMLLEKFGLVEEATYRRMLLGPQDPRIPIAAFWTTLAAEIWLRGTLIDKGEIN